MSALTDRIREAANAMLLRSYLRRVDTKAGLVSPTPWAAGDLERLAEDWDNRDEAVRTLRRVAFIVEAKSIPSMSTAAGAGDILGIIYDNYKLERK